MLKYSANAPPALRNLFHRYEDMKVKPSYTIDVLCVGAGTYDLVYSVDRHPEPDEKIRATVITSYSIHYTKLYEHFPG